MKKPILVFDLDGTFADTAPDLLDSLNHSLRLEGLPEANPTDLLRYVSHGGRAMIERAFQNNGSQVNSARLDRMILAFLAHYEANMPGLSMPYPRVLAAIQRFTDAGYIHAICTNKYERMSKRLLSGIGTDHLFKAICGQDTFPFKKPDPRHLTETIRMAGGDPDHAIMIGDSKTDIDTAKAAGIPVIAVNFGYSDRPVAELEPSIVISSYDELTLELADRLIANTKG